MNKNDGNPTSGTPKRGMIRGMANDMSPPAARTGDGKIGISKGRLGRREKGRD